MSRCWSTYFVLVDIVMLLVNELGYAAQDVVGLGDIVRDRRSDDGAVRRDRESWYIARVHACLI